MPYLKKISTFQCLNKIKSNVSELYELKYFKNLEYLDLSDNEKKNLIKFKNFKNLEYLNLFYKN